MNNEKPKGVLRSVDYLTIVFYLGLLALVG